MFDNGQGKLIVVSGGQTGSEAKGHVAEVLLDPELAGEKAVAVRVGGPNAGHIVYGKCPPWCDGGQKPDASGSAGDDAKPWGDEPEGDHWFNVSGGSNYLGHPWKLRQVPVAAVTNPKAQLLIAAGSEVNIDTLREELEALDAAGYDATVRLLIDRAATVLTPDHIWIEKEVGLNAKLGSTAKGIGAARADRIMRNALTWNQIGEEFGEQFELARWGNVSTALTIAKRLSQGYTVLVEGTQGYGLGLHTKNYPFTTSGNCRAIDFLAQAGISPWHQTVGDFEPWLVVRTRPIRVAGNSGPLKGETSWEELGLKAERTTVTKKVRRVGEWNPEDVREAIFANGGHLVKVALTMVDQVVPECAGVNSYGEMDEETGRKVARFVAETADSLDHSISWIGTGPTSGFFIDGYDLPKAPLR